MLETWWKASMREGLKEIGKVNRFFHFTLVYWADYLHSAPLNPTITDKKNPLYLDEFYSRAKKGMEEKKPSALRKRVLQYLNEQMDKIFLNDDLTINHSLITDFIIHHFFSDLESYYKDQCVKESGPACAAKIAIGSHLLDVLKKHRRKKILLIAHSMGSIIAYDVLIRYAQEISVDTLVTIGSPLGLPIIKNKIIADSQTSAAGNKNLKTPENITRHWFNLSDLKDKISLNYRLCDDFAKNSGQIQPVDKIVVNDYEFKGQKNPHTSYGYLRTPEMAAIVRQFLEDKRPRPFAWLRKFFSLVKKRDGGK